MSDITVHVEKAPDAVVCRIDASKALATIQRRDEKLRPRRIAAARTDPRQLSIFGQSHTQELTNGFASAPTRQEATNLTVKA